MYEPASLRPRPGLEFAIPVQNCPIRTSLGALGRKWALLVLRDVALHEDVRFSDILRGNPGLTPRALSICLRNLRDEGFVVRVQRSKRAKDVVYDITARGRDAIPILAAFMQFGMRHHADDVFADGAARNLDQVMPGAQRQLLGDLIEYAAAEKMPPPPQGQRGRRTRRRNDAR